MNLNAGPLGHPGMAFMPKPGEEMQQQAIQQPKLPPNYPGQVQNPILRNVNQPGPPGGGMQMQMQPNPQQGAQRGPFPPPNPQMNPQMMQQRYNSMMMQGFAPPFAFPNMSGPFPQPQFRAPQQQMMPNQQMSNLQQIPQQMGPGNPMGMGPVGGPATNLPGQFTEPAAPNQREMEKLFENDKSTKMVLNKGTDKEKSQDDERSVESISPDAASSTAAADQDRTGESNPSNPSIYFSKTVLIQVFPKSVRNLPFDTKLITFHY